MFVDTQMKGPYLTWYHTHYFIPLKRGVLMVDDVRYRLPFGFLGSLALPVVKRDIQKIFAYRRDIIEPLFSGKS